MRKQPDKTSRAQPDAPSLLDLGSAIQPLPDNGKGKSWTSEALNNLPPSKRAVLAQSHIRQVIRQNARPEGLTTTEIADLAGLDNATVRKHLDTLCKLREVYRVRRNRQFHVYFPNGKPLHDYATHRIGDGDSIIEVQAAEGPHERLMIHIIEKRISLLEGETAEGSIMLPLDKVQHLISYLQQMAEELSE